VVHGLTYAYFDQSGCQLLAHVKGHRVTVGGELVGTGVEGHKQRQQLLHRRPESLNIDERDGAVMGRYDGGGGYRGFIQLGWNSLEQRA